MQSKFLFSAAAPKQFPETKLAEIAFIGRSNSGKSTLLNVLMNRKNIARVSATPGRTQLINFFAHGDKQLYVDLPGYGYSATSNETRKNWDLLIESYATRHNIACFLFLMDIRRKVTEEDLDVIKYFSRYKPLWVVLTKRDTINQSERHKQLTDLTAKLDGIVKFEHVYEVSSKKLIGIPDLKKDLRKMV